MYHREFEMKTLKISDEVHGKLTAVLGELMAKTGKMKTYQDAIDAVLNARAVRLFRKVMNVSFHSYATMTVGAFFMTRIVKCKSCPQNPTLAMAAVCTMIVFPIHF